MKEGKYTVETFAEENGLGRQSALNKLSRLKKLGFVEVSGGSKQKRIYTVRKLPKKPTNGFYDTVNKYSPEKLQPRFEHYVNGRYTVEDALIDGLKINDARTLEATAYLFGHVTDWKGLFNLARKASLESKLIALYKEARKNIKVRRMPKRYVK